MTRFEGGQCLHVLRPSNFAWIEYLCKNLPRIYFFTKIRNDVDVIYLLG